MKTVQDLFQTLTVLNPLRQVDPSVIHDNDLAGPLAFCLLFGVALLLVSFFTTNSVPCMHGLSQDFSKEGVATVVGS